MQINAKIIDTRHKPQGAPNCAKTVTGKNGIEAASLTDVIVL